ncbi:MAG: hypothetical protein OXG49_15750 [Chloroflexi bacterium]|nr:hypothetical protein [Chloroflexota bacterium]
MKRIRFLACLVFTLLLIVPAAMGQEDAGPIEPSAPELMNPEAHISYPPPVYVVRDSVDIRGTVTLEAMRNFFIEFRPLVLDMMMAEDEAEQEEEAQWFPATLPRIEAVEDDVLGAWNTVTLRDGLYELRLTINTGDAMPAYYRVSPIRVENNPPFAAEEQMMAEEPAGGMDEAPAAEPAEEPEEEMSGEPEAETMPDSRPRVTATVNANVRAGDSTVYAVVGFLLDGESALIKGVSSRGTGWYYIELANGRSGFIYPFIVNTEGDLSDLPRINPPPPPPPTPVLVPTAVPAQQQPQSNVDLVIAHIQIHPHGVKCGQTYEIQATVRNVGGGNAPSGGLILARDSGQNGTAGPQTTQIAFGALNAGATQVVVGHLTPTVHVETLHHITLHIDHDNRVVEINENNNVAATAPYHLASGC